MYCVQSDSRRSDLLKEKARRKRRKKESVCSVFFCLNYSIVQFLFVLYLMSAAPLRETNNTHSDRRNVTTSGSTLGQRAECLCYCMGKKKQRKV